MACECRDARTLRLPHYSAMLLVLVLIALCPCLLAFRLPYIKGGSEVDAPGKWPWMGTVQFLDMHVCGCALISDRWVVTAAHCLDGGYDMTYYEVGFGFHDVETKAQGARKVYKLQEMIVHPQYIHDNKQGIPNDIALLKTQQPVDTANEQIQVIALPDEGTDFSQSQCWMTGWGKREYGMEVDVLVEAETQELDKATCSYKYRNVGPAPIRDHHICLGATGVSASCGGDSGGPVSCQLSGRWYVAGLTSWGSLHCSTRLPSVYTRLSYYRHWINQLTGV